MDNLPPGVHPADFEERLITECDFEMTLHTGERVRVIVEGTRVYPEIYLEREDGTRVDAEEQFSLDDWWTFWSHH